MTFIRNVALSVAATIKLAIDTIREVVAFEITRLDRRNREVMLIV